MPKLQLRSTILSIVGLALWPTLAAASDLNNDNGPTKLPGSENMAGSLVWVIVSLFIVIALIVVLIKWLSTRNRAWGTNRSLRSLGGIALGQNNSMQVVELAGRVYIVGVGENVTLIDKIDDLEQAQAIVASIERQSNGGWSPNGMAELLKRFRQRDNKAEPSNEQWNESSSFQNILNDNLNRQADRKQQIESLLKDSKPNERLMDDNEK
ncbi:MAG: flagellar biosynthetic protein FliO [Candidatus Pristimantibacillus sp.]